MHDHLHFGARQAESDPDTNRGEDDRNQRAVQLDRVFDDEVAVLDQLQKRDEEPADNTVKENRSSHEKRVMECAILTSDRLP
ncbi:MAG: hypothetical protein ABIT38_03210 [Gemmatimonadaceae bacterium]